MVSNACLKEISMNNQYFASTLGGASPAETAVMTEKGLIGSGKLSH